MADPDPETAFKIEKSFKNSDPPKLYIYIENCHNAKLTSNFISKQPFEFLEIGK